MLGDIGANKRLAWQFMQIPKAHQYAIWLKFSEVKRAFPSAILEALT